MLFVIAANRKNLFLSIALACLPCPVAGMEELYCDDSDSYEDLSPRSDHRNFSHGYEVSDAGSNSTVIAPTLPQKNPIRDWDRLPSSSNSSQKLTATTDERALKSKQSNALNLNSSWHVDPETAYSVCDYQDTTRSSTTRSHETSFTSYSDEDQSWDSENSPTSSPRPAQHRFLSSGNIYALPQLLTPQKSPSVAEQLTEKFGSKLPRMPGIIHTKFQNMQLCCNPNTLDEPLDSLRLIFYIETTGDKTKSRPRAPNENITKIKPEELLDTFWGSSVIKHIISAERLSKIDKYLTQHPHMLEAYCYTIELVGSSAAFLVNNMSLMKTAKDKESAYLEQLSNSFYTAYRYLSKKFPEEERYHYYVAKYLISKNFIEENKNSEKISDESYNNVVKSCREAWPYITQCHSIGKLIDAHYVDYRLRFIANSKDLEHIRPKEIVVFCEDDILCYQTYKKEKREFTKINHSGDSAYDEKCFGRIKQILKAASQMETQSGVLHLKEEPQHDFLPFETITQMDKEQLLQYIKLFNYVDDDYKNELEWIKYLKLMRISSVENKKKTLMSPLTRAQNYLEIARLTHQLEVFENAKSEIPEDTTDAVVLDSVKHYLDAALHYYAYHKEAAMAEMSTWGKAMLFYVGEEAEVLANGKSTPELSIKPEKYLNNRAELLEISRVCYKLVFEAYELAAQGGDITAYCMLGWLCENGQGVEKNDKVAAAYYLVAATAGDAEAQARIAVLYEEGRGVEKNYVTAAYYYQKAAKQGFVEAEYNFGWMCEHGLGVKEDQALAFLWYQQAAEDGHMEARFRLGLLHEEGRGVPRDDEKAAQCYAEVAEAGNANAQFRLSVMLREGRGVQENPQEAMGYCQDAVKQGHPEAILDLGWMHLNGYGTEKSNTDGVICYENAAEFGSVEAKIRLGILYEEGQAVKKNYNMALKYYEDPDLSENPVAHYRMGLIYANGGYGVEKNNKIAQRCFEKAQNLGYNALDCAERYMTLLEEEQTTNTDVLVADSNEKVVDK